MSPSHEQRRLRLLFETLLQTVINYAFELLAYRTFLDNPLLVVLDEAANFAPTVYDQKAVKTLKALNNLSPQQNMDEGGRRGRPGGRS